MFDSDFSTRYITPIYSGVLHLQRSPQEEACIIFFIRFPVSRR